MFINSGSTLLNCACTDDPFKAYRLGTNRQFFRFQSLSSEKSEIETRENFFPAVINLSTGLE